MTIRILNIELSIKKVNKKRKVGYSSKRWGESETNTLLRLSNEGTLVEDIAKLLGRTKASINTRLSKVRKQHV